MMAIPAYPALPSCLLLANGASFCSGVSSSFVFETSHVGSRVPSSRKQHAFSAFEMGIEVVDALGMELAFKEQT